MVRVGSWRRVWVVAGLLTLLLSACDWTSFGFDAGNTRFNPNDTAISAGNVSGLAESWRSTVLTGGGAIRGTPAVANGRLFVQAGGSSGSGRLAAYDATGAPCPTATPKVCSPLWQSSNVLPSSSGDPTVVDGKVYVVAQQSLQVYDAAAGSATCTGTTPRICAPLWTTYLGGYSGYYGPTVVNGRVFLTTVGSEVRVYDTSTSMGCSGTTTIVCPTVRVYRAAGGSVGGTRPVVVDGVLYVGGSAGGNNGSLYAFDATGNTGCSGNPIVCSQLWSGPAGGYYQGSTPVVSGGRVYTHTYSDELKVFDAKGCGTSICAPLWSTSGVTNGYASPAVANGRLYVANSAGTLGVFDAKGCGSASCTPLWTSKVPVVGTVHGSSPALANGLVYLGSNADRLYAFDANGTAGCHGANKVCDALWTSPLTGGGVFSSPIVANGIVFVGSDGQRVHAYKL